MRSAHGFTLIELMIVIAVIALISAIALPAYQDYTARAQVAEAFGLATGAKLAIATYYGDTGRFPANNVEAGMASAASINGNYVESVSVNNAGEIVVLFSSAASAKIRSQSLVLTAGNNAGSLRWRCGGMEAKYLPSTCR